MSNRRLFDCNRAKKSISRSLNLDSGCIGFKCCKRGGGGVTFGHLTPVIQCVTPSRMATPSHAMNYRNCFMRPETNKRMHKRIHLAQSSYLSLKLSLFPVCDEQRNNPLLSRRH